MGGNWKCCSQAFDYVEESMWRAGSIVVLGALGILEGDTVWDGRGKLEVVLDQSSDKRAIWKRSGTAVSRR